MDIKSCKKTTKPLFCSCFFCTNTVSCMTARRKFRECVHIDERREMGISKYFRQRLSQSKLIPFIIFVFPLFLANKYRDIEFINFDRASSIDWQQLQLLIKRSQILSADRTSSERKVTLLKRDPLSFLYHLSWAPSRRTTVSHSPFDYTGIRVFVRIVWPTIDFDNNVRV